MGHMQPHLQILLRVPVAVVDDDRVRGRKVDAKPPRPCAQQEELVLGVLRLGAVEAADVLPPHILWDGPVNAAGLEPTVVEVCVDQIEHLRHLGED